jgi:hypothetical protein
MVSQLAEISDNKMLIPFDSDITLKLNQEEVNLIQAELKTLTALRRTTAAERLMKCMLSPIWEDTSGTGTPGKGRVSPAAQSLRKRGADAVSSSWIMTTCTNPLQSNELRQSTETASPTFAMWIPTILAQCPE